MLILTITLTFVAPGKWNTVLNEFGDPSSSTMWALMAELNAVKLTWDEVWRFPDGFKNAFSPVKVIRKRNGNITPYQDKTFNPLTPASD